MKIIQRLHNGVQVGGFERPKEWVEQNRVWLRANGFEVEEEVDNTGGEYAPVQVEVPTDITLIEVAEDLAETTTEEVKVKNAKTIKTHEKSTR